MLPGEQVGVLNRSSSTITVHQERYFYIVEYSSVLHKLNEGYTVPDSFKLNSSSRQLISTPLAGALHGQSSFCRSVDRSLQ